MKAVVLEIRNKKAAVLTTGGQIIKVNNNNYMVGEEVNVMDASERIVDMARTASKWMPAAVAAAFLVLIGRFTSVSMQPYGVVSLDVNPSIEFTINNRDKVLSVNGVNDDGKDIISEIDEKDLINQSIEKAVNVTIDKIESEGYLAGEDRNYVVIAANTIKESHTDELVSKIDTAVIENNENVQPITIKATDEEVTEARQKGTSAGKMIIVSKLESVVDEAIDKDEWLHKSVADIVNEYDRVSDIASLTSDDGKSASKSANKSSNEGSDNKKDSSDKGSAEVKSTPAATPTATPAATATPTSTPAATKTPSVTATPTPTPVPTAVATAAPTPAPTAPATTTPSSSEDDTPDPTSTPKPTTVPAVTPEPTPEPTPVIEPPMPEPTPEPTPVIDPPMPEPTPEPEPTPPSTDPGSTEESGGGDELMDSELSESDSESDSSESLEDIQ